MPAVTVSMPAVTKSEIKPKKAISNKSHLLCPYCRTPIDLGKLIVNGDPVAEPRKDPFDAVYTQFTGKRNSRIIFEKFNIHQKIEVR